MIAHRLVQSHRSSRRGYSLVDLMIGTAISAIIVGGMGASMVIVSRSIDVEAPTAQAVAAQDAITEIARDLRFAMAFTERTSTAATFSVPDRNGDGEREWIRYAWAGTKGDPLTRQVNGGPMIVVAADVSTFDMSYLYRTMKGDGVPMSDEDLPDDTPPPPPAVLFVSGGMTLMMEGGTQVVVTPTAAEQGRIDLMTSWGHVVDLIADEESQAVFDAAIAANDVAYVSPSISGGALAHKLTGSEIGIVSEFPGKLDNYGLSSSTSTTITGDTLLIVDDAHAITSGLGGGSVTVLAAPIAVPVAGGTLAPDLQNLAEISGAPAVAALETGGQRFDLGTAPARRVHLPFANADALELTTDGTTIMRRAIEWAAAGAPTGPDASLVAHWTLDDGSGPTAADALGSHDATLSSGPTWTTGTIGGALAFDGTDDHLTVPADVELDLVDQLTLAAWIWKKSSDGYDLALNKGETGGNQNFWLGTVGSEITFGFNDGSFREFRTSGIGLQPGTWYHIAATLHASAGEVALYLNGTAVSKMPTSTAPLANGDRLQIGRSQYGEHWHGLLDDVRIYDIALTAGDVMDLVTGGAPIAPTPPPLLPVADTYIVSGTVVSGSGPALVAGSDAAGDHERGLLQFDTSGIPAGAQVTSAVLRLNASERRGNKAFDVGAHRVTESWDEGTATWDTRDGATAWTAGPGGSYDPIAVASTPAGAVGWYEWTVTALVQGWGDGSIENHGVILVPSAGVRSRNELTFDSRESATPPELVIEYEEAP